MRVVIDLQSCQTLSGKRGIGRYSAALAQAMARNAGRHELWLALNASFPETVPDIRRSFDGLVPRDRIRVFEVPTPVGHLSHENEWRVRAAELLREDFLQRIRADVVHVSSLFEGFADDAVTSVGRLHHGERTAVTLYDLIMWEMPDRFLADERRRSWYYRKLQSLKNAGLLLGISQFSCREAVTRLGLPEDRVVNISSAVDARFKRLSVSPDRERELRRRYGLAKPFLMSIGAADPHKNLEGLIEAFALLQPQLRRCYQLAIIFGITDHDRKRFTTVAHRAGLERDELVFTGCVSDEVLVDLYNLAALYVMPSFIEGFGLPAVEAMACGVPAIGSNRTSVPEAIGRPDALFDPFQPKSMADKISEVLTDDGFRLGLIEHGERHARSFSWDATAKRAMAALETLHARQALPRSAVAVRSFKPTLAVVVPPDAKWRAHENLLAELAGFYDVELICDDPVAASTWIAENFRRRSTAWFEDHAEHYDRIVHLFDSEDIALSQLELLSRQPGTALLHERAEVVGEARRGIGTFADVTLRQLAYLAGGYAALARLQHEGPVIDLAIRYAHDQVVERAGGVIFLAGVQRTVQDHATVTESWCTWIPAHPWSTVGKGDAIAGSIFDVRLVHEAIERFAAHHPKLRRMALLQKIAELPRDVAPTEHDLIQVATALASQEPSRQRTLYLDISLFALNDNKSGIHRVVRNIVRELAIEPPEGLRVETIREQDGVFWTARAATFPLLDLSPPVSEESAVDFKQGD
ncbi:MAG: glycosyltransferase family 4 protein, partial [Gammaproteobacteria bacterium]|nr:glycosyltransferase family 4 protein [Gammaproteobacteria bacterium]